MNAKKVLIVSRREIRKNKLINWVSEIYLQILGESGIIPIIIPIAQSTIPNLSNYLDSYDGLLMVEGGDVNPQLYGKNYDSSKLQELDKIKDTIEFSCCSHAIEHNKPILGICRGLHILNVLHGGTLYCDIHEVNNKSVIHCNYSNYDAHRHTVSIIKNTPLHSWYNQNQIQATTYHHQGIQKLGNDLVPMATSDDNLIEAVYHPKKAFVVGLQFHPERMLPEYEGNARVFESFISHL